MDSGGFLEFIQILISSLTFGPSYGANVALFMWLLLILIGYNVVLSARGKTNKSNKLKKLVLAIGLFGTLYSILIAVNDVGNPDIVQEAKLFELMARSLFGLKTTILSLFGWIILYSIEFLKDKES